FVFDLRPCCDRIHRCTVGGFPYLPPNPPIFAKCNSAVLPRFGGFSMSLRRRAVMSRLSLVLVAVAVFVVLFPLSSVAQDEKNFPKVEVFGGYSWLNPGGNLPVSGKVPGISKGWDAAAT